MPMPSFEQLQDELHEADVELHHVPLWVLLLWNPKAHIRLGQRAHDVYTVVLSGHLSRHSNHKV